MLGQCLGSAWAVLGQCLGSAWAVLGQAMHSSPSAQSTYVEMTRVILDNFEFFAYD